jgi:galactokinase/mevalonate kinase-like predicted kinase
VSYIEQILSRTDISNEDTEQLKFIRMHSEGAYAGLLSGLGAIGNITFWACDNKEYTDEMARADLCSLGEMLMYIPGITAALKFNADEADFAINDRERKKKR